MRAVDVLLAIAAVARLAAAALFSEVEVENLINKARQNPELSGADIIKADSSSKVPCKNLLPTVGAPESVP